VKFDFSMTYPRGNRFGFIYEPWHWALNSKIGEEDCLGGRNADKQTL
jgi:LAS superfamily LD-carboxypeptidase LdcB